MVWPFDQMLRPLIRDILYWTDEGETREQVFARLTGPKRGHDLADVESAWPEAMRAAAFRERIEGSASGVPLADIWGLHWEDIFREAYGRNPTFQERAWAKTQPGERVGVKVRITVAGVEGWESTPTVNAPWSATLDEIMANVDVWFYANLSTSERPNEVESALAAGARVNMELVGGALLPRIDPTVRFANG